MTPSRPPLRAILFDLDGTLLPIDFESFLPRYLGLIAKRLSPAFPGVDLVRAIMTSTQVMMQNDGTRTNQELLWSDFGPRIRQERSDAERRFDGFYRDDFPALAEGIASDPGAVSVVETCRDMGLKIALATNPIFPRIAIDERARWAGLHGGHFDLVTAFEGMRYCKPHPGYYSQIAEELEVAPSECMMVGNDVSQDLKPAASVGMRTCLVINEFQVRSGDDFVADHICRLTALPELVRSSFG